MNYEDEFSAHSHRKIGVCRNGGRMRMINMNTETMVDVNAERMTDLSTKQMRDSKTHTKANERKLKLYYTNVILCIYINYTIRMQRKFY